jgi:hypothetical protein
MPFFAEPFCLCFCIAFRLLHIILS